jgi:hypothetical protein
MTYGGVPLDRKNYQDILKLQSLDHTLLIIDQIIASEQEAENNTSWLASNEALSDSILATQHVNLTLSARSFGDNLQLAKQMITTMLANFYTDLPSLQEIYDQQQWPLLQNFIQQLRGMVAYCGTPRLEAICINLEKQLIKTTTGQTRHSKVFIRPLYRQLLLEIKTVQSEITEMDPCVAQMGA